MVRAVRLLLEAILQVVVAHHVHILLVAVVAQVHPDQVAILQAVVVVIRAPAVLHTQVVAVLQEVVEVLIVLVAVVADLALAVVEVVEAAAVVGDKLNELFFCCYD